MPWPVPAEQRPERRITGQVVAQHHGVDERADQTFEGAVRSVRDRDADGQIRLAGDSPQEHGEGGEHGHEQGHAGSPGENSQLLEQRRGNLPLVI